MTRKRIPLKRTDKLSRFLLRATRRVFSRPANWRRYRAWLQTEEGQYYATMDTSARAHRERKETT